MENRVIYKFTNTITNDIYIGSTKHLQKRMIKHYSLYINGSKTKVYTMIDDSPNGWYDIDIDVIETLFCDKKTARIKEEFYRKSLEANMNTYRCFRTREDGLKTSRAYYESNKDVICAIKKKQYESNPQPYINRALKHYHGVNHSEICRQRRELYKCNKDQIAIKHKKYYDANRDIILAKARLAYKKKQNN